MDRVFHLQAHYLAHIDLVGYNQHFFFKKKFSRFTMLY